MKTFARFQNIDIRQKLLELSILGFLFSYPYSVRISNGFILSICFFSLFTTTLKEKMIFIKYQKWIWFFAAYFLLIAISVLYSTNKKYALSFVESSLPLVLFPFFLGTALVKPPLIDRIFKMLVISTCLAAVISITANVIYFQAGHIPFKYFFDWEYTYLHLTSFINFHPSYFSLLCLISILVLIFKIKGLHILRVCVIGFLALFIFLLGAKMNIILLVLIFNVLILKFSWDRWKSRGLLFYVILNLAILTILYNIPVTYWRFRMAAETFLNSSRASEQSKITDYRLLHWGCANKIIVNNFLFGVGMGDSAEEMDQCYLSLNKQEMVGYNAHCQFLQSWINLGIPGLLLVFLCLTIPYFRSAISGNYFFMLCFLIFIFQALVESIFSVQKGISLFCFMSGLYLGPIAQGNSISNNEK